MPGCRHGKLFIHVGRPCKKRADDLLKLGRHQLKMAVAILKGHAAVRGHLRTMGLFNGDPSYIFCRMERNSAAILPAAARRWLVSDTSLGSLLLNQEI
jgi:hypothetical protein